MSANPIIADPLAPNCALVRVEPIMRDPGADGTSEPTNQAPLIDAGPAQTITIGTPAILAGTVSDDGLPSGGTLTHAWTQDDDSDTVTFSDVSSLTPTISFPSPGTYIFTLTASDGQYTASSSVTITVLPIPLNGQYPQAGMILASDGNFYGTTGIGGSQGGSSGMGVVYRLSPSGILTVLYNFTGGTADGGGLICPLLQGADGSLYGVTAQGGANGWGTLFKLTLDGVLTVKYHFPSGSHVNGPLIQVSGDFYGTFADGGSHGGGAVFKMASDGTFVILYNFPTPNSEFVQGSPFGLLTLGADGKLYGTTETNPTANGSVFALTLGGALTTIYDFVDGPGNPGRINNPGTVSRSGGIILASDGNFYGTTYAGGDGGGTIYRIAPNGTVSVVHSFSQSDGYSAYARLTQGSDGALYGAAYYGGSAAGGTVFKCTLSGTFTVLHSFDSNATDGNNPLGALVQGVDGNFYGTNRSGGSNEYGTVFKITPGGAFTKLVDFTG